MEEENKTRICPYCKKRMTGCACSFRKAKDGAVVHAKCLERYNKLISDEQEKREK